jgi:hypothetical protein
MSGGDGFGGSVTFGYNSGQWNFGAWGGAGEGLSGRFNPGDSGCAPPGFNPSIKEQFNWNLGGFGGGGFGMQIGSGGSVTVNGSYSTGGGGNVSGSYNFSSGDGTLAPTYGRGSSAFGGAGGTYTSPSSDCGCKS